MVRNVLKKLGKENMEEGQYIKICKIDLMSNCTWREVTLTRPLIVNKCMLPRQGDAPSRQCNFWIPEGRATG